jgi:hypothetical protein
MPSLQEILAGLVNVSPFQQQAFDALGTDAGIGSAVGIARGTTPGEVPQVLQNRSNEELAELDRVQFNRRLTANNPIAGAIGATGLAANDALKAAGVSQKVAPPLMRLLGFGDEDIQQFSSTDENTSRPSLQQLLSNFKGASLGLEDFGSSILAAPFVSPATARGGESLAEVLGEIQNFLGQGQDVRNVPGRVQDFLSDFFGPDVGRQ